MNEDSYPQWKVNPVMMQMPNEDGVLEWWEKLPSGEWRKWVPKQTDGADDEE